jgi:hypothetical protein
MNSNRKSLLEAAHRQATAEELGHAPVWKKRNLQNTIGKLELRRHLPKSSLDVGFSVREGDEPDIYASLLEPPHGRNKGKGSFGLAKLAINTEVISFAREITP